MTDQEIKNYIQSLVSSVLGKRIDQLPQGDLQLGDFLVFRDMTNGVTKRVPSEQFMSGEPAGDFRWLSDVEYAVGSFVTYGGKWYEALAINTNVVPGSNNAIWLEGSKVSGVLREWQPGLYVNTEEYVVAYDATSNLFSWRLVDSVPRPFNSSDFLAEVTAGKWEAIGGSGGGGGVSSRKDVFRFNSNLFTEHALSFRGLLSTMSQSFTAELSAVAYESRLDSSSSWTAHANLSAVQTWITTNISGTELAGTRYWIKCLAVYGVGKTGEAENTLIYTPS